MTNSEIYNTIAESLQCDIDTNAISYEYASIINDIAYDKFITESELPENVESILDRYISEASAEEMTDEDCATLESYVELIESITEAYDAGEITSMECDALYESVHEKIDVLTEGTLGAGGARGKFADIQVNAYLSTVPPILKAIIDYYKREVYGNNANIDSIKAPTVNDLLKYCKLDRSIVKKNADALKALSSFSAMRDINDLDQVSTQGLCTAAHESFKFDVKNADDFKKWSSGWKSEIDGTMKTIKDAVKQVSADIATNTAAKNAFKSYTGQNSSTASATQKAHDEKLAMLKERNAKKMALRAKYGK